MARRLPDERMSRAEIIVAMQRRNRAGRSVRLADVRAEHPELAADAMQIFGSWTNALQAAGLPVARRAWSAGAIRAAILDRHRQRRPLNAGAIQRDDPKLRAAIAKRYGAVNAAVSKILAQAGLGMRDVAVTAALSKTSVVRLLRLRRENGLSLRSTRAPSYLVLAARRNFGSWQAALQGAGINPEDVLPNVRRTDDELLEILRRWSRERPNFTIKQLDSRFGRRAIRAFGSLSQALAKAGVHDWPPRKRQPLPSRDELLVALRERYRRGASMRQLEVQRQQSYLFKGALKYFGNWRAAMEAAGLGNLVWGRRWTAKQVLDALRVRHEQGGRFDSATVQLEDPRLFAAAGNYFLSLPRAIVAAGLPLPKGVRWRYEPPVASGSRRRMNRSSSDRTSRRRSLSRRARH